MENWILALNDFLDCLAEERRNARSAKEMAIIDCEIEDVTEMRAFIAGFIKGKESNQA